MTTPDYLHERAAHYRRLAGLATNETLATWLRAVAAAFAADAAEREAAARLAAELGKKSAPQSRKGRQRSKKKAHDGQSG